MLVYIIYRGWILPNYNRIDCFISHLFDVFSQGSMYGVYFFSYMYNKFMPHVERVDLGGGNSTIFGFFNPRSVGK